MSDMHHYNECGLDYIYLLGLRYQRITASDTEETVDADLLNILEADLLHHEIAKAVVLSPHGLRGQELAFLRNELKLKVKEFCRTMGVSPTKMIKWEDGAESLPQYVDACMRLIYAAGCSDGELGREIIRMLRKRETAEQETAPSRLIFDRGADGWRLVRQYNVRTHVMAPD